MDELNLGMCTVAVTVEGDIRVVRLAGELDISGADAVRAALERAVPAGVGLVVFDLSDLQFMDSSGIALMLEVAGRTGAVELRRPSPIVRRIVEATGLVDVLGMGP
jgi:anti-anti-sigma factor